MDNTESNDVNKMAQKIQELEQMLRDTVKRTTTLEEVDMNFLFPNEEEENKSSSKSNTDTKILSVNTADDTPFLSKISEHKFKQNGAILFLCQDSDEDNETWCDANKAITNVGTKTFKKYVSENNLKKKTYTPTFAKNVTKTQVKSNANKSKIKAGASKDMIKIIGKRKAKKGVMYKVVAKDLTENWKTIEEIGSDYPRLLNEYQASLNKQKKSGRVTGQNKTNIPPKKLLKVLEIKQARKERKSRQRIPRLKQVKKQINPRRPQTRRNRTQINPRRPQRRRNRTLINRQKIFAAD